MSGGIRNEARATYRLGGNWTREPTPAPLGDFLSDLYLRSFSDLVFGFLRWEGEKSYSQRGFSYLSDLSHLFGAISLPEIFGRERRERTSHHPLRGVRDAASSPHEATQSITQAFLQSKLLRPRSSNHGCPWIQKSSERTTVMLGRVARGSS